MEIPWSAMAMRAMDSCSPIASSWSSSRSLGSAQRLFARAMSSFVTPARAERTTTTSWPSSRAALIRSATFLIRSTSPTEVPPYFWTILDMVVAACPPLFPEVPDAQEEGRLAHAAEPAESAQRPAHRALVALVRRQDEGRQARLLGGPLDHARYTHVVPGHD